MYDEEEKAIDEEYSRSREEILVRKLMSLEETIKSRRIREKASLKMGPSSFAAWDDAVARKKWEPTPNPFPKPVDEKTVAETYKGVASFGMF